MNLSVVNDHLHLGECRSVLAGLVLIVLLSIRLINIPLAWICSIKIIPFCSLTCHFVAQLACHLMQQITSLVAGQLDFQAEPDDG